MKPRAPSGPPRSVKSDDSAGWIVTQIAPPKRDHAAEMAELEKQFKAGRKRAVLDAILVSIYAIPEKPVPLWAKRAFAMALYDVAKAKAASWDDVFGPAFKKGTHVSEIQKQRAIREKVYARVMQ